MPTLSKIINFEKAYEEILFDEKRGDDFIPDILNFVDTRNKKEKILRHIKTKIDSDTYKPRDLIRIEIPKANFCIRPGARPYFQDWIAYHAITNYIGLKGEPKLKDCVYSNKFDKRKNILIHSVKRWLEFQKDFWDLYNRGYKYVLTTDITSYFANINLDKLRTALLGIVDKSEETEHVINYLFNNLLRIWSKTDLNYGFGIPQGIAASRILGNLFLHQVDSAMFRERGIKYLRYVDDIRILARDEKTAKIALKKLIESLRELGLDLNDKKTDILKPESVEKILKDPNEHDMDIIDKILESKNSDKIKEILPLLIGLFYKSFERESKFIDRHLKFCVNRFTRLIDVLGKKNKEDISNKMTDNLVDFACLTNLFCKFLNAEKSDNIKKKILKFLRSENNIYDWQEMWLLSCLLKCSDYDKSAINLFAKIAFDKNKHPMCRTRAILLLGKYSNGHYRHELTRRFNNEENYVVKRAIIVAVQELNEAERNDFYNRIKSITVEYNILIDYIKGQKRAIYYDEPLEYKIKVEEPY